ncbi:general secretion pathway protein GspB [Geoalkalibacter sp.]|uniref:general secretion pathway protein GspB n=1 Tax=Geoalkalibacter sp. TaxID=3041440 RepID=UPI00272E753D|nr:general secretion pathway protein GspB [Geoalkalibacter sp.]
MSLILDALRKSDKKRPTGAVPDLQTEHLGPPPRPKRKVPLALILIAVALLLNAGLLLWWLKPWQTDLAPQAVVTPSAAPVPEVAPSPAASPIAPAPAPPAAPSPPAQALSPPAPPAPPILAPPPAPSLDPPVSTFILAEDAAPAAVPEAWVQALTQPQPAEVAQVFSGLPLLQELPSDLRAGLPEFVFSLHYFTANPAERLARINGRLLREGQVLAEGLVLDEITEGGAVFEYRGQLFEVLR